jgi:cellulose synthase operon protein C
MRLLARLLDRSCQQVHAFADGELSSPASERFQEHLLDCARCLRELEDIFALRGMAETAAGKSVAPVTAQFRVSRWPLSARRWVMGGMATALAGAVGVALLLLPGLGHRDGDRGSDGRGTATAALEAWTTGPTRRLEARLADPRADTHRPYDGHRGAGQGGGAAFSTSYAGLAALQAEGDTRGLVSRLLLDGRPDEARKVLEASGKDSALDHERAVLALLDGRPEEALTFCDRVLRVSPRSAQAQWNRALALREMGLGYAAAQAFEAVAGLGEPGWSAEARTWARKQREVTDARKQRWEDAERRGLALAREYRLPDAAMYREFPDLVRSYLYAAARSAETAAQLRSLRTVAEQLDAHYGSPVLTRYLDRLLRLDLRRRAPLARKYAQLQTSDFKEPRPGFLEDYRAELRRAGPLAADLMLGLRLETARGGAPLDDAGERELQALVRRQADPWFDIVLLEIVAGARSPRMGEKEREDRLLAGIDLAARNKLELRRLKLQVARGYLLLNQHRLREAEPLVRETRSAVQALGFWKMEVAPLLQMAHLAFFKQTRSSLVAYRDEVALVGASCAARSIVQARLAERAFYDGDPAGARRAIDEGIGCDANPGLEIAGLAVLSELGRADPRGPAGQRFRQSLQDARPGLNHADGLMALALEGRFTIDGDRPEGRRLLEEAIAQADQLDPGDLRAIKPRLMAYRRLVSDAVAAGEPDRALALIAAEGRIDLPSGCVLGMSEDLQRGVVVARGQDGVMVSQASVPATSDAPVGGLLSGQQRAALVGCPEVAVLALPPFHGRARLLPPEMVWYHHSGGSDAASGWRPTRRLVVSDAPAPLGLPPLPPWQDRESVRQSGQQGPRRSGLQPTLHLRGPSANPARVREAMARVDLVEFHVHGLVDVSDASYLALSPDEDRHSTLTAGEVRRLRLPLRPLVVLAACNSAASSRQFPSYSGRWSLPSAFLDAGARAVVAANVAIPDRAASAFFDEVVGTIETGVPAARALRDTRMAWLRRGGADWVEDVVLFQ